MGYNLQRFSPLTQINKDNAKNLVPVWNYSFADDRAEESQPIVYQGVIYVTTHAATMAVDVKTGKQIWKTKVEYPPETPRIVCCGIINRGAAITRASCSAPRSTPTSSRSTPRRQGSLAPEGGRHQGGLLDDGGAAGRRRGGADRHFRRRVRTRGFIDGWDPATGKHLWRTHTIPTPDEPGGDTWKGDTWKLGGGSTWITVPTIRS